MKDNTFENITFIKDDCALPIDWFSKYNKLSKKLDYLVEITNFSPENQTIEMPNVIGQTIADALPLMTADECNKVANFFIKVILDLEQTTVEGVYGNNLDLALDNVIISKNKFVLIDPNSFQFNLYFDYVNYSPLLFKLLEILEASSTKRKRLLLLEYDKIMDNMQSNKLDVMSAQKSFLKNKEIYINKYLNNFSS